MIISNNFILSLIPLISIGIFAIHKLVSDPKKKDDKEVHYIDQNPDMFQTDNRLKSNYLQNYSTTQNQPTAVALNFYENPEKGESTMRVADKYYDDFNEIVDEQKKITNKKKKRKRRVKKRFKSHSSKKLEEAKPSHTPSGLFTTDKIINDFLNRSQEN